MANWYPSGYCQRYGFKWCTPPYDGPPHYPKLPDILVVDLGSAKLRRRRRRFWQTALDLALDSWEPSGLQLEGTRDANFAYVPGTITIDLADTPDGTAGWAAFGLAPVTEEPLPGAGWVQVDTAEFEKLFRAKASRSLEAIIAHEVGHTFGFGHGPAPACMDTDTTHNTRPTLEELAGVREYFQL